jgi:hypothetical protein
MISRTVLATTLVALVGSAAWASEAKVEITGLAGYTFSDGVTGSATDALGNAYTRIDPNDAFSWGVRIGYNVTPAMEVGWQFKMQATSLKVSGPLTSVDIGDESIYNYHGYFAYNFLDPEMVARPFILIGLGATQFGSVKLKVGTEREIAGNTKFSGTLAGGIKITPSRHVGIVLQGSWTPTYIKTDTDGWWCDPYWGCYAYGNAQYANQLELSGGITLRF